LRDFFDLVPYLQKTALKPRFWRHTCHHSPHNPHSLQVWPLFIIFVGLQIGIMKKVLLFLMLLPVGLMARETRSIDKNWEFVLSDATIDQLAGVEGWRTVYVPHDWSIEGEFDRSNPSGQGGAYLPTGIGWYRKTIKANIGADERLFLEFDGVMACSSVYVDGQLAGYRPN
jgi:beta-galactosidase